MATYSSLKDIFENPLPKNPSLIESLSASFKQYQYQKQANKSNVIEIFGELHFKESSTPPPHDSSSSSSSSSWVTVNLQPAATETENNDNPCLNSVMGNPKNGFSIQIPDNLKLCTEGLGFESSDEVENSKNKIKSGDELVEKGSSSDNLQNHEVSTLNKPNSSGNINLFEFKNTEMEAARKFPPPLSSIGKTRFKAYRYKGRLVLKEFQVPDKEDEWITIDHHEEKPEEEDAEEFEELDEEEYESESEYEVDQWVSI